MDDHGSEAPRTVEEIVIAAPVAEPPSQPATDPAAEQPTPHPRRCPTTINIPWPVELNQSWGSPDLLCGITVYHDFDWQSEIGHGRIQFPNGKTLATLANEHCPVGRTAVLLLTILDGISDHSIDTGTYFILVVRIRHYLRMRVDAAKHYLAQALSIPAILQLLRDKNTLAAVLEEHLTVGSVSTWLANDPTRIDQLKQLVAGADGQP